MCVCVCVLRKSQVAECCDGQMMPNDAVSREQSVQYIVILKAYKKLKIAFLLAASAVLSTLATTVPLAHVPRVKKIMPIFLNNNVIL